MYVNIVMHVCGFKFVRECMCACVRAYNERKLNPGSPDPKIQNTVFLYSIQATPKHTSFPLPGRTTDWEFT